MIKIQIKWPTKAQVKKVEKEIVKAAEKEIRKQQTNQQNTSRPFISKANSFPKKNEPFKKEIKWRKDSL